MTQTIELEGVLDLGLGTPAEDLRDKSLSLVLGSHDARYVPKIACLVFMNLGSQRLAILSRSLFASTSGFIVHTTHKRANGTQGRRGAVECHSSSC